MVHFRRGLIFLALLSLASARQPSWPHERSDLSPHPAARFGTLSNGLRYLVLHNAEPRDHVAVRLLVLAGSLHEREKQRGFAHFVEHMAFASTRSFPRRTLVDTLQRHGIAFGADATAFTYPTHTVYQIDVPLDPGRERLDEAFLVLREFASEQTFDVAEIDRERGVIQSERLARDHWQARATQARAEFVLPDHLYPQRNPMGDDALVNTATASDLREFYAAWYRPDNAILLAVGDLSVEELEEHVTKHFASWTQPSAPLQALPALGTAQNPAQLTARYHREPAAGAVSLELTSVISGSGAAETLASRTSSMQQEILMSIMRDRLEKLRRERSQDFGMAQAFARNHGQDRSEFSLLLDCSTLVWTDAVAALAREWRRAHELGFSAEELAASARLVQRRFDDAALSSEPSRDLADRFALALASDQVPSSWEQLRAQMNAALASLTPETARTLFRTMWSDRAPRLFCLANLPLSHPAESLIAAFESGLEGEVLPLPTPAPAELRYAPAPTPAKIRRRQHVPDLDLHLVEFANGIRLNLKRTDFSRNSVLLRARIGSGRLGQPAHSPGLALLAGSYLNDAGVGQHDGHELQRFIDERNLALSFGTEEDAFVFMGGAETSATSDLLRLLSAYLSDPAWRDEEFGAAQRRIISHFHDAMHEPFSSLQTYAARVISRNDPRFVLPPPSITNARTLAELMTWIGTELKSGSVEIGLVGDFDLESTIEFAARTLGALPRRESRKSRSAAAPAIPFERKPGRWITSVESSIPRAAVRAQWPVRGCGDIHQRRRLETLAAVMQNRVRREIREQLGATYDPNADVFSGDTLRSDGYLLIQISTSAADASRLADRIVQIAADIAEHGVSEEELQAVVQPRLAENAARLRENSYWLFNVVSAAQTQPTRLDWPRTRASDYARQNCGNINRLASDFLAAKRAQIFVVGPSAGTPAKSLAVH